MAGVRETDEGPFSDTPAERGCMIVTQDSQIMTGPGRCTWLPTGGEWSFSVFYARCRDREGLPVAPARQLKPLNTECLRVGKGGSRSPALT